MARQTSSPDEPVNRKRAIDMARMCASSNLRRVERQVTDHYDEFLHPTGVTALQLPILAAISAGMGGSIGVLAESLGLERSTLSRDLRVLEKKKLLEAFLGDDRRTRSLRLTRKGARTLDEAYAAWQRAHAQLLAASENLEALVRHLRRFERSITQSQESRIDTL